MPLTPRFKFYNNQVIYQVNISFQLGLKMYKKRARKSVRRTFFSQRVINPWNLEKREVVQKEKTSGFKKGFDDEE